MQMLCEFSVLVGSLLLLCKSRLEVPSKGFARSNCNTIQWAKKAPQHCCFFFVAASRGVVCLKA